MERRGEGGVKIPTEGVGEKKEEGGYSGGVKWGAVKSGREEVEPKRRRRTRIRINKCGRGERDQNEVNLEEGKPHCEAFEGSGGK